MGTVFLPAWRLSKKNSPLCKSLLLLDISVLIWHFIASQSFFTLSSRLQAWYSSSNFPTVSHILFGVHWLGDTDSLFCLSMSLSPWWKKPLFETLPWLFNNFFSLRHIWSCPRCMFTLFCPLFPSCLSPPLLSGDHGVGNLSLLKLVDGRAAARPESWN